MDKMMGTVRLRNGGNDYDVPVFNRQPANRPDGVYMVPDNPIQDGAARAVRGARLFDHKGRALPQEFTLVYQVENGTAVITAR